MAEWRNGGIAEWQNGGMAEWRSGGMAEWRNGKMAEWHNERYEIVWNQDTESTQMPPWQSPSWLVRHKKYALLQATASKIRLSQKSKAMSQQLCMWQVFSTSFY
jgi:hypothetical protein